MKCKRCKVLLCMKCNFSASDQLIKKVNIFIAITEASLALDLLRDKI